MFPGIEGRVSEMEVRVLAWAAGLCVRMRTIGWTELRVEEGYRNDLVAVRLEDGIRSNAWLVMEGD
jgi:hypothetical protein